MFTIGLPPVLTLHTRMLGCWDVVCVVLCRIVLNSLVSLGGNWAELGGNRYWTVIGIGQVIGQVIGIGCYFILHLHIYFYININMYIIYQLRLLSNDSIVLGFTCRLSPVVYSNLSLSWYHCTLSIYLLSISLIIIYSYLLFMLSSANLLHYP